MSSECTFPVCPKCNGEGMVPQDDHGGRRHYRCYCKPCNGSGIVSFDKYKELMEEELCSRTLE